MGHCREIASTDRVVEQFASSRDSTIRVIGLSGFLGGALGGCGGGWGGRGGGGGGVHSLFGGFFKLGWGLAQFLRQEFKKKPISSKIR